MLKRIVDSILDFFRSLFWKQEMELTLVGLQNSGKTTLVNVISVSACLYRYLSFVVSLAGHRLSWRRGDGDDPPQP